MQLTTTHKLDAQASSVSTVTIFRTDCAEVARKFTLNLKNGDNVIEISHLPHTMVAESLRVAGIGAAMLSDVVCIAPKVHSRHNQSSKSDALIALEEEKDLILSQRRVVDHQATVLVNYSKTITGEHVSPDDMLAFLGSFVTLGDENSKAQVELNRRLRDVEKRIAKELEDPVEEHDNSHLRNMKVKLTINAQEDQVAELTLTYLVKRASWTPVFDLRAVTGTDGKPTTKLALHYRATVSQSTGEDWADATLNLSTASPDVMGTKIPTLSSIRIAHKTPFGQKGYAPRLFGQPQGNNIFGQPQGNNIFGQPASNTGLFGQPASNTSAFGQPASNTSAFGGGLFGQSTGSNPPAPPATTGGLFGTASGTTGFGAFGTASASNPAAPPPPTGGIFGTAFGTAGSGAFGTASTAPDPTAPSTTLTFDEAIPVSINPASDEPTPLPEMEIPSAVAKENSMAANFQVKGTANIKSDGSGHRVAIAVLNLTAKIHSVVVPRSLNGAYLHCIIHNSSTDTHLLPGNMGIYLDEGYITNTTVPHVAPGESFKCSLGRDYSVGVTCDQVTKRIETPNSLFGSNWVKVAYTVTLTLKNKRDSPIHGLVVRDVVPVSDVAGVKVLLLKPEGLADAEEGKDVAVADGVKARWFEPIDGKGGMKEGRYQWLVDLDGRETKILTTEWEVSAPPGIYWGYHSLPSTL